MPVTVRTDCGSGSEAGRSQASGFRKLWRFVMENRFLFQTGRYSKQIATLPVLLYNKAVKNRKKRKNRKIYGIPGGCPL